ncbi:hypothetical protein NC653_039761 [Populus alba x Populus x berolinensis]|uniref:Uncharacterized protein n=1 Tax=Populus alba x Populus x berolinensis TaxID=444605 RepID=A0AAD6LCN1_9ROSI|nr:hypothetical protein NC653_039761 [Populus alba x Populus x berolinensis]
MPFTLTASISGSKNIQAALFAGERSILRTRQSSLIQIACDTWGINQSLEKTQTWSCLSRGRKIVKGHRDLASVKVERLARKKNYGSKKKLKAVITIKRSSISSSTKLLYLMWS